MKVQIIDIGNSKGIRIPQAVLKQVVFGSEVEMEVAEGKITLKRALPSDFVPIFNEIPSLDDAAIQQILRRITGVDLLTALVDAEQEVKDAIYRNLSKRVKTYIKPTVERLEAGDAKDLLIERSRNIICEALVEVTRG